jgi:hypothetical protein
MRNSTTTWQLCVRALRRHWDPTKVFKAKEVYAWISARPKDEQYAGWEICRAFLAEKAETYEGFREKYLGGIPAETREAVLDAMAFSLQEVVAKLPLEGTIPDVAPGWEDEVLADLQAMEKEAKRLAIEIPASVTAAIETARARAKRLQQIAEVENMLANRKEKPALAAIAQLRVATDLTDADRARLARLAKKAKAAPFDRLVERLNVDGLF